MIYCVEDDHSIRDLMIYTLTIAGFEAHGFADSEQFWKAMQGPEQPELILLDIMLPGEDGISILIKLRFTSSTAAIPVIMATAKGSEYDRPHIQRQVIHRDVRELGIRCDRGHRQHSVEHRVNRKGSQHPEDHCPYVSGIPGPDIFFFIRINKIIDY